jgi:hypothetical protein
MELEFSRKFFEKKKKSSNIKFHQNPSSGSRTVPCGKTDRRMDGHDEANNRFSQFCERILKNSKITHSETYLKRKLGTGS